jgi:RNA-directed DNA polymerase
LLANLYLHLLDRIGERHDLAGAYGARLVRYADERAPRKREGVLMN